MLFEFYLEGFTMKLRIVSHLNLRREPQGEIEAPLAYPAWDMKKEQGMLARKFLFGGSHLAG